MSLLSRRKIVMIWGCARRYSPRSTLPLCEMHLAAKLDRTSLISDGFRRHPQTLSSPPPQGQVFAGTKDSRPRVSPLRWPPPLIVSRVKYGGGPCRSHVVLPCTGNTISLQYAFLKNRARFDIGLPETRSGRDRALPI